MLKDNIPVFTDLAYRTTATFNLNQFNKILDCITEFGTPLSLNQAYLLKDYEAKLLFKLTVLYSEFVSPNIDTDRALFMFIDLDDLNNFLKKDTVVYREFRTLQKELIAIDKIKRANKNLLGGCNCG